MLSLYCQVEFLPLKKMPHWTLSQNPLHKKGFSSIGRLLDRTAFPLTPLYIPFKKHTCFFLNVNKKNKKNSSNTPNPSRDMETDRGCTVSRSTKKDSAECTTLPVAINPFFNPHRPRTGCRARSFSFRFCPWHARRRDMRSRFPC